MVKRSVYARQVFEVRHDMELRQMVRAKAGFPARNSITGKEALGLEVVEILPGTIRKLNVPDTVLEIAPDMVDVGGLYSVKYYEIKTMT